VEIAIAPRGGVRRNAAENDIRPGSLGESPRAVMVPGAPDRHVRQPHSIDGYHFNP